MSISVSASPYPSLREKQKHALKVMINLNEPVAVSQQAVASRKTGPTPSTVGGGEPVWKLLIFDRSGQDIISPLLSVKELRELGVTLHVLIDSERDAIPDVPVIYFVLPSDQTIGKICQDFKNQLYDRYYLNFITPVSRTRLEELANTAFQTNVTTCISKIFDQFSNFVSLEDEFFVLKDHDRDTISFYALNRPDASDSYIDGVVAEIVEGLFSVCVTLGVVPIIRCPKGNAAEMVSHRLEKKLRETLQDSRSNIFSTTDDVSLMPRPRPLMVILDRNMDMATPLHHTWTYQAMAHDVLKLSLNRLKIDEATNEATSKKSKPKLYDLSSQADKFWSTHRGSPFPQVAEAVQEELDSYRSSEEEVRRLKVAMGISDDDTASLPTGTTVVLSDATAKLNSAVSSLPELMEKKKVIDMHTTIATALLEQIKNRKLDTYFELEEKLLSKGGSTAVLGQEVLEFLKDPERGSPADKLRLYLIYLLCDSGGLTSSSSSNALSAMAAGGSSGDSSTEQLRLSCEEALREAGCDLKPLQYMKRWKTFSSRVASSSSTTTTYGGGIKTVSMFSKLMSQGSQFVMEGVKNLVVKKHLLPVTRITDALMDNKTTQEVEDYLSLDPKSRRQETSSSSRTMYIPTSNSSSNTAATPFQEAIVFVIGGGNYIEYQNLMDHVKTKSTPGASNLAGMATKITSGAPTTRRITYGCTDLMNADQFLQQLSMLGE